MRYNGVERKLAQDKTASCKQNSMIVFMAHRNQWLRCAQRQEERAVAIDLQKEAPNVVTEAGFKMLVESGYSVEVVCKQDAYRKNSVWHGIWLLRAVNDDGVEKELVTARARPDGDFIQLRVFKTVTGLTSFLIDLGFSVVAFPVYEGQRWTYTLADTPDDDSDG